MNLTFSHRCPPVRLLLCAALLLAGSCRPKPPPPASPTPSPTLSATPAPTPATQATPEQITAVVRVRVAFGGLPPRDTAAALLARDEVPDPSLARGKCRFVVALLKGWEERQLRGPDARIVIYRNLSGRDGRAHTVSGTGWLVQFDPATGLGVLAFYDNPLTDPCAGFRLPRGGVASALTHVLRTRPDAAGGFSVVAGPASADDDPVQVAASSPDVLAGFVDAAAPGAPLTPLEHWKVALRPPRFDVAQPAFEFRYGAQTYDFTCAVTSESGETAPGQINLYVRQTPPEEMEKWLTPDAVGDFTPLGGRPAMLVQQGTRSAVWRAVLPEPVMDQQSTCLAQLSWTLVPLTGVPEVYGQPFIIRFERQAGKLTAAVLDQPPPVVPVAAGAAVPARDEPAVLGEATMFPLGAAAREVHLIAGGREALIHLDAPPYWRRFSFEKRVWLPLPAGGGAGVSCTGNLTSLFVLDPSARTVRRFRLPGLEPDVAVTLPPTDYVAVLAGGDGEHAPVFVATADDSLALDPATLQPLSGPELKPPGPTPYYLKEPATYPITGDGLGFARVSRNARPFYHYNNPARGLEYPYLGIQKPGFFDGMPGVTAGFSVDNGVRCLDTPGGAPADAGLPSEPWTYAAAGLSENAPVVFRLLRPERRGNIAPGSPRLGLFSLSGALPFAEADAPELANLTDRQTWNRDRWAFFDPYSRQLATLGTDRRTWHVRALPRDEPRRQPVLLNWPDTVVPRGGKLAFRPQLFGGTKFAAEVLGQTGAPAVDEAAGTLSWPFAADGFASLELLTLRVPGADGGALAYPVLLHAAGPEWPFAAPPTMSAEGLNERGAGLASLGTADGGLRPLPAALYRFPAPVAEMAGPVAGCLALIGTDRLDFFSLLARRVVGSTARPPGAWYYPGAGALLEYDPGKRTLTRISVPDARREASLPLPPGLALRGIGVGTERGSPVTLAVEITLAQSILRFSDRTFTDTAFRQDLVVLDGQSLRSSGKAQPVDLSRMLNQKDPAVTGSLGFIGSPDQRPVVLPASRDGSFVSLPRAFVALGPDYAVVYPNGEAGAGMDLAVSTGGLSGGSLTGLMAFSGSGQAYKGGAPLGKVEGGVEELGATPDGRYQFRRVPAGSDGGCVDVLLAESGHPLLRLGRLPFLEREQSFGTSHPTRRVLMLGPDGPLALLSGSGRALELVDLDVATLARQVVPEEFHVVSQPVPVVMEGRTLQYQVRVNHPEAVREMRLQNVVSGLTLSLAGVLSYTAPANLTGPMHVMVSIEITGQNGQVVLHEFPIYVLPSPRPGAKTRPGEV